MLLKLLEKKRETPEVESFIFEKPANFEFVAGQYLKFNLEHSQADERGTRRYFSISATPHEDFLMITTKYIPDTASTFKSQLNNLSVDETIEAEGPRGEFTFQDTGETVFIAGGIGITPFRSILLDLDYKNLQPKITLLYSSRTQNILFKQLFDEISIRNPNLKIVYTVTEDPNWSGEKSQIDPDFIKKYVPVLQESIFYVSGPEPMVEAMGKMLVEMGVPEDHFKQDFFPGYEANA
ncbi:MAG: FAD-dependent oxidoreductase [Candidatus Daviesbacteria bacterium]|nr:FAD-dependent oxidoreductase [Candidatus Daviesbacteria bacterium]